MEIYFGWIFFSGIICQKKLPVFEMNIVEHVVYQVSVCALRAMIHEGAGCREGAERIFLQKNK